MNEKEIFNDAIYWVANNIDVYVLHCASELQEDDLNLFESLKLAKQENRVDLFIKDLDLDAYRKLVRHFFHFSKIIVDPQTRDRGNLH